MTASGFHPTNAITAALTRIERALVLEAHHTTHIEGTRLTLSALYPKGSEEKRLLDAMLLVVPRYASKAEIA